MNNPKTITIFALPRRYAMPCLISSFFSICSILLLLDLNPEYIGKMTYASWYTQLLSIWVCSLGLLIADLCWIEINNDTISFYCLKYYKRVPQMESDALVFWLTSKNMMGFITNVFGRRWLKMLHGQSPLKLVDARIHGNYVSSVCFLRLLCFVTQTISVVSCYILLEKSELHGQRVISGIIVVFCLAITWLQYSMRILSKLFYMLRQCDNIQVKNVDSGGTNANSLH